MCTNEYILGKYMLRFFFFSPSDCITRLACTNPLSFQSFSFSSQDFFVCLARSPRHIRCKCISVWWNSLHHIIADVASGPWLRILAVHLPCPSSFSAICWQMMWFCPCLCDWHRLVCQTVCLRAAWPNLYIFNKSLCWLVCFGSMSYAEKHGRAEWITVEKNAAWSNLSLPMLIG